MVITHITLLSGLTTLCTYIILYLYIYIYMMHMYTVIHLVHQQPCPSVMGILGYTESITQQQGAVVRTPTCRGEKPGPAALISRASHQKNKHGKLDQCGHFLCWIMLNTYMYIYIYIHIYIYIWLWIKMVYETFRAVPDVWNEGAS